MNKTIFALLSVAVLSAAPAFAQKARTVTVNPPAGGLPALGNKPTGAYGASKVEAKLNVDIKDGVDKVHFIRDNNDPFVVTKAYVLKHADPYTMKGIIRHAVASTSIKGNPVAVDAIRYVGGTGVILISAEEYRFKKNGNNTGFDELVATYDKPKMSNTSGSVEMIYYPRYNKAEVLLKMLRDSRIGLSSPDGIEFAEHPDGLDMPDNNGSMVDPGLNAILLSVNRWDLAIARDFLKKFDNPSGHVRVTYKLVEVFAENDQKLGLDFQAWKNNDGIDIFAAGGKFGTNWRGGKLTPNLSWTDASFYNFNPKWNSKYIDFLATCGKAKIVTSGTVLVADGHTTSIDLKTGALIVETKEPVQALETILDNIPIGVKNKYHDREYKKRKFDELSEDVTGQKLVQGKTQIIKAGEGGNSLLLTFTPVGAGVTGSAARLQVGMKSDSIIGWTGTGEPRMSSSSYAADVQIGQNRKDFVIGGITKSTVTRGVNGVPFLKDLPVLGWVFSTETDTVKKSQYVLIASVEPAKPADKVSKTVKDEITKISGNVDDMVKCPIKTAGYQQLLLDTTEIK
ncbi:MAG: hypothetical protein J6331_00340 [Lentisphaeria bacterium]|nr:hypothetical protein [Lentisphaeria bacterium]